MLPVGIGLLKGRSSSLHWAKFWIGLFSLLFASLLVFYPFLNDINSARWFDKELVGLSRHIIVIGPLLLCLVVAGWFWRTLSSSSTKLFFSNCKKSNCEMKD